MEWELILSLIFFAFCAGTIDAAVGGGGLIQIPALMGALPNTSPATIFGTNKLASICGTASAAFSFARRVKLNWKLLLVIAIFAFISSFAGAACVSMIPTHILRPFVLVMLVVIAIYTFMKKQFGQVHVDQRITPKLLIFAAVGSLAIGFYDGILGPGTGTYMTISMKKFLHLDYIISTASTKPLNLATNLGSAIAFVYAGKVLWMIAIPMAIANMAGSYVGTHFAIKGGESFIKKVLIFVLVFMLLANIIKIILN